MEAFVVVDVFDTGSDLAVVVFAFVFFVTDAIVVSEDVLVSEGIAVVVVVDDEVDNEDDSVTKTAVVVVAVVAAVSVTSE